MNKIPANRIAISFVDEKHKDIIHKTLSTSSEINIVQIDFIKINPKKGTPIMAYNLINTLCANEFRTFIVGLSRPFDIVIAEAILERRNKEGDISLIIVTTSDDIVSCDNENRDLYNTIINSADKVLNICLVKL